MSDPVTIQPGPLANEGLDYAELKERGTGLIQDWSGDIWTDYNESDPGVTILEQLCYALTELSYRAEFPLEDLLVDPETGVIDPHRQALFPPVEIFDVAPVTEKDYRKLILDQEPALANVWLEPIPAGECGGVNGLYRIWLYLAQWPTRPREADETKGGDQRHHHPRRKVFEWVFSLYTALRDLCEDVADIRFLNPVNTLLRAEVVIAADASVDDIMAEILFRTGLLLAPEPRRHSLYEALKAGLTPAEILTGPLLQQGLVNDDELQPRRTEIPVRDIVRTIVEIPAVKVVNGVEVRVGSRRPCGPEDTIHVPDGAILTLETQSEYTVRIAKKGVPCRADPNRVNARLYRLWAAQRRRYDLEAEYAEALAFPSGEYRDVRPYYSIQNQFPNVYGINSFGLPKDAEPRRKGHAKQLKGYLLAFEQLMANFFAQLANARRLYSVDFERLATYFYQYLDDSVPNVEPLLKKDHRTGPGYHRGLPHLVHSQDPAIARRNRFLDLLLALYAEELSGARSAGDPCDTGTTGNAGRRLLRAKQRLLSNLVASLAFRGTGFDYLARPYRGNIAGMLIKSRIQLGLPPYEGHPGDGWEDGDEADDEELVDEAPPADESFGDTSGHCPDGALYVVEHVLLRYAEWRVGGEGEEDPEDVEAKYSDDPEHHHDHHFDYSMTLSAVVYPGRDTRHWHDFVDRTIEVVRRNAPADVMVEFVPLGHRQLAKFEWLYRRWRRCLRAYARHLGPRRRPGSRHRLWHLRRASRRLRHFLAEHRVVIRRDQLMGYR